MNTLLIYYSLSGNTRSIAKRIAERVDADIVEIRTVEPYQGTQAEIDKRGIGEVIDKVKPQIMPLNLDWEDYDRIILGTPVWQYCYAPAVRTALTGVDFEGKIVCPFITHEGEPMEAEENIRNLCEPADVMEFLSLDFSKEPGKDEERNIREWIDKLVEF